ncbi:MULTISPECIES: hypothetical protein [unclassified Tolypothrix]|uniref:hypothetical protein n=1 Tax=unclassified Tolypothrix TaxID=2649714 RepID=UPI0005F7CDD0|nr:MULTISPECIES: hypothetical protein [unclassified Tolypothrix]MBE9082512.1 hypothetical protein [Tolypothrix sp. LEGE 11397]UYD25099.1 hypothetical protein HGR01_27440 [Tolypothrix sp. PCC 7712]UYD32662.1 hypothetical protein HG267_27175 [Tolypothrix sp. PCC 7601]BAY90992.1 hypothetical protein NIES3275_30120 [Microchaete diplosiphon NIES-3275]
MTPTLFGRWQTRLLLLATVGVLVSLPFAMGLIGPGPNSVYFLILTYVAIFGLGWDVLYNYLQKFRWDRDWPAAYQLFAGIWEFIFVYCGVKLFGFLPIPIPKEELPPHIFLLHYSIVWLAVFFSSQSLMRIIFPRWRFRGGEWL